MVVSPVSPRFNFFDKCFLSRCGEKHSCWPDTINFQHEDSSNSSPLICLKTYGIIVDVSFQFKISSALIYFALHCILFLGSGMAHSAPVTRRWICEPEHLQWEVEAFLRAISVRGVMCLQPVREESWLCSSNCGGKWEVGNAGIWKK